MPRPTERPTESIASSSASNCPQQTYAAAQHEASFTFVFDSEASFTFDGASAVLTRLADVLIGSHVHQHDPLAAAQPARRQRARCSDGICESPGHRVDS